MITSTPRFRRAAMLAGTSLLLSGALFAPSASAAVGSCDGLPVEYTVPSGGALFQDPDGSASTVIEGTNGTDWIQGLGGNDTICGLGGNDVLQGGQGDDFLDGGPDNDEMHGGENTDTLYGGGGANDVACGAGGGDFADGGADFPDDDTLLPNHRCEVFVNF